MKLTPTKDGHSVRLRYGGAGRERFVIKLKDAAHAQRRAERLQQLATLLVSARRHSEARVILTKGAAVISEREFAEVVSFTEKLCAETIANRNGSTVTFKQLGEDWTSGKLHEQWPDHVKLKKDVENDKSRLSRLYETIGDVQIVKFTLNDAERAMDALPKRLSPLTRRRYGQLITRILRMSVYPLKLREHNPLPAGFLPSGKSNKVFAYIYPSEDEQLAACTEVPFVRRLLYGFLAREGCRLGEALSLRWCDLDLERGVVRLDENKTDEPRTWAMSAGVATALAGFRPKDAAPEAKVFGALNKDQAAKVFREHLQMAGVNRVELFECNKNRRPIRVHDLRASFVTISLASGRTESWVADRTGHRSSDMINKYRRQARQAAELELGTFKPLNEVLGPDRGGPQGGPKRRTPESECVK